MSVHVHARVCVYACVWGGGVGWGAAYARMCVRVVPVGGVAAVVVAGAASTRHGLHETNKHNLHEYTTTRGGVHCAIGANCWGGCDAALRGEGPQQGTCDSKVLKVNLD